MLKISCGVDIVQYACANARVVFNTRARIPRVGVKIGMCLEWRTRIDSRSDHKAVMNDSIFLKIANFGGL